MQKIKANKSLQPKNILGVSKGISKIGKHTKWADPSLLPIEADGISTVKQINARNPKEKFLLAYPTGGVVINQSVCTTRAIVRSSSKVLKALIPQMVPPNKGKIGAKKSNLQINFM